MVQARYIPSGSLASFVKCFWYWEGVALAHSKERLMPNGEPTIVFQLRDEPIRVFDWKDTDRAATFGHALLSGPRTEPFVIETSQQERVFGIQFQPGGSFPFFRASGRDFENRDVALDLLWPQASGEIRERLLEASGIDQMFRIAEAALLAQLTRPLALHPAVSAAVQSFAARSHTSRVAAFVDSIGISHRRFVQLFSDQVGTTPKAFCRVQRFQRVLRRVQGVREIDWTQIALDCGYYDQAHFIHDFQGFSGFTPTVYSAIRGVHLNHVPLV